MIEQARWLNRRLVTALIIGLAVHVTAATVFVVLASLGLEGCDTADGLASSLFLAAFTDLIISGIAIGVTTRRNRGYRRFVLLGWTLSFVPAVMAACAVLGYVNALPSGCAP